MVPDKDKKVVVVKPSKKKLTHAARQKILKEGEGKIELPEMKMAVMFVPNRVTEASYQYTLYEERILNHIIHALQEPIRASMNGMEYKQMDLFKNSKDSVSVDIPMNEITSPNHYPQLRSAIVEMGKTEVHIYSKAEQMHRTIFLFRGTSTWSSAERSNTMRVEFSQEVAELLIEVEKNRMGKPMHYTSFLLQAANSFSNKYGSRVYKMISGWKEKGMFRITMEDLRTRLGLGKRYPRYTDIRKNILIPVQEEMERNKAQFDCWFDCNEEGFAVKTGRNVTSLCFKVYTPAGEEMKARKVAYAKTLLTQHFGLTATHLSQLDEAFNSRFMNLERMMDEITRLGEYCVKQGDKIKSKASYVTEALLRMFAEERRLSTQEDD